MIRQWLISCFLDVDSGIFYLDLILKTVAIVTVVHANFSIVIACRDLENTDSKNQKQTQKLARFISLCS